MRLIDADALIECIKDELYDNESYWYKLIADALIEVINNMPTIKTDPEPAGYDDSHLDQIVDDMLHLRWIIKDSKTAKCPCCGWWQNTKMYYLPDDIKEFTECYRYCTSCGQKMH